MTIEWSTGYLTRVQNAKSDERAYILDFFYGSWI